MSNGLIQKAVEAEIRRRLMRGELMLPSMVEEDLEANLRCKRKMLVIAYNRALGIGAKRYREKVLPELVWVADLYLTEKAKTDETYARSLIDRMYTSITGEED